MLRRNDAPGKETVVPISCSILPPAFTCHPYRCRRFYGKRDASDATKGTEKLDFQSTTQEIGMTTPTPIGFIGLGTMGLPMALNLANERT